MAGSVTTIETITTEENRVENQTEVIRLQPSTSENVPHVTWTADTIDNEHMGRLKSNCCCIYTKPRVWDDPSTWEQDENETEHCRGHTLPNPPEPREKDQGGHHCGGC